MVGISSGDELDGSDVKGSKNSVQFIPDWDELDAALCLAKPHTKVASKVITPQSFDHFDGGRINGEPDHAAFIVDPLLLPGRRSSPESNGERHVLHPISTNIDFCEYRLTLLCILRKKCGELSAYSGVTVWPHSLAAATHTYCC